MSDDQQAKDKQTTASVDANLTVISVDQAATTIDADQFSGSKNPRSNHAHARDIAPTAVPTAIGAPARSLIDNSKSFVEAKLRAARRHPEIEKYTVILLDPKENIASGFLVNNAESSFMDLIEGFMADIDESTKIAVNRKILYIGIVKRSKVSIYNSLIEEYGFGQSDATKLAQIFHELAGKARKEGVGFLQAISEPSDRDEIRKAAMEFRDRTDRAQKASAFLEEHYGSWLRGNGLYQNELRRLDKSLMQGLNNEFRGRFDELADVIPTKRSQINALLGPDAESMSTAERKRALDTLRARIS